MFDLKSYNNSREAFSLFVKVSEFCNINCSFCYQKAPDGDMINTKEKFNRCFENIDYWIEKLVELRKTKEWKHAKGVIVMFGGEPTANPYGIKKICEHLKKNHFDKRDFLFSSMTTNGTIYNEEIIKDLYNSFEKKITIMVSCDSTKEDSDLNRKFKLSNDSVFEKVMQNVDLYRKNDLISSFSLASVYTDKHNENDFLSEIKEEVNKTLKQDKAYRRKKFVDFHMDEDCLQNPEVKRQLKDFADIFYKNGKYLIENLKLENKEKSFLILKESFRMINSTTEVSACQRTYTIDCEGNFVFCNKNKLLPDGTYNPEVMKSYVFDLELKDLYQCSKNIKILSNWFRIEKQRLLTRLLLEKYTEAYNIPSITISDEIIDKKIIDNINSYIEFSFLDKIYLNKEAKKYFNDKEILDKIVFIDDIDPLSTFINKDGKMMINIFEEIELTNFSEIYFYMINQEAITKREEFLESFIEEINNI